MWALLGGLVLLIVHGVAGWAGEAEVTETQQPYPIGDVRYCPTTSPIYPDQPLYRMEVLPGGGFDGLRNLDMGQVHYYNYSRCSVSNDGRYLLPDNIFLIPTMKSHVEAFAEFFDHWDNYTSTTSRTISVQAGYASIVSAKFSDEYLSVKSHQFNDQSKTTRVQLRHALFKVKIQPDSQLHPTFKSRLFEIAANVQNNNTKYAHYLAELLVRDYGTHYVTTMEAGAVLSQVDHIKSSYFSSSEETKRTVTASASANFFGKISFSSSFSDSTDTTDKQGFEDNRMSSEVFSWGGPPFQPNFTVSDWEKGVPAALVGIDRSGDPLQYVITPAVLPEMPESTIQEVADLVFKAIERYYKVNTRHGCTNPVSPNFDFQANVNDNSCKPRETNFTFGGIYQTCEYTNLKTEDLCYYGPEPVRQVNPLTGDTSCPSNYEKVLLHTGKYTHTVQKSVCHKSCSWWHCHNNCGLVPFTSVVYYNAYWCVAMGEVSPQSGYLFGGYYTSTTANPFTGTKTCPRYFMPLHFGEDIQICVSNDYELGSSYAVPFAGFESCISGNPLAASASSRTIPSSWPHACPYGYSQHLVAIDEGCEVNFCIKAGAFNQYTPLPPRLPPFRKHRNHNPNVTDTFIVIGNNGDMWYKNSDGVWVKEGNPISSGKDLYSVMESNLQPATNVSLSGLSSNPTNSNSLSNGAVAAISVVSTISLCTLIVVVVFAGCSILRKKKLKKDQDSYLTINEGNKPEPQESNI